MRDSKKKHPKFLQPFPEQLWGSRSIEVPGCSHDSNSESGEDVATQYFSLH